MIASDVIQRVESERHVASSCSRRPFVSASFLSGPDLAGGRPGARQKKMGLTKSVVNNARQLSRSLLGIYH